MSTPTTSLQSALYVTTACTIRVTYDPLGVPATSDLVVAAGTYYQSAQAFLDALAAQVAADIGAGWTFASARAADSLGWVTVTTPGLDFEIAWSHAGDGTAIRDWLGEAADVGAASPYTFTGHALATYFPELAAQRLQRAGTSRPLSTITTLDGATQTQGNASHLDTDEVELDVALAAGPTAALTDLEAWETFLTELSTLDTDDHFTLYHGAADSYHGCMVDEELRLPAERVQDGWDGLWRLPFRMRVLRAEA